MKLSTEDMENLNKLYADAQNTPVILLGGVTDISALAWKQVANKMDELGEKYGFNPRTMKGINRETGEVDVG